MFAMSDLGWICASPFLLIFCLMLIKLLRNIAKQHEERELKRIDPKVWAEMKRDEKERERLKEEQARKAGERAAEVLGSIAKKMLDK
jgi:hypothetical protein